MTFEEWSIGWNIPQTVDSEVYAMAHEAWNFNGGQERQAAHAEGVAEGRAVERGRALGALSDIFNLYPDLEYLPSVQEYSKDTPDDPR